MHRARTLQQGEQQVSQWPPECRPKSVKSGTRWQPQIQNGRLYSKNQTSSGSNSQRQCAPFIFTATFFLLLPAFLHSHTFYYCRLAFFLTSFFITKFVNRSDFFECFILYYCTPTVSPITHIIFIFIISPTHHFLSVKLV